MRQKLRQTLVILGELCSQGVGEINMAEAKPVTTLLACHFKLSSKQCPQSLKEKEKMAQVPYASEVRSLMYAVVCTRPDLAYAVSTASWFMSNPGKQP